LTKAVNWTTRLPRASLRGVAEATRPIRAVFDTTDPPPTLVPDEPDRARASLAAFASKAADEATRCTSPSVEVRPDRGSGPRFLPPEHSETLTVTLSSWPRYPAALPGHLTTDLPAADGRFAVALCVGTLERSPEPLPLMTELGRILEPDGQLFLVAPLIVPEPSATIAGRANERRRYGLNYLLDAASLRIEYLESVERSSAYAVIARKSSRPVPRHRRAVAPS